MNRTPQRHPLRVRLGTLIAVGGLLTALAGCSAPTAPPSVPDGGVRISTNTPPGARAKQALDLLNSDGPIGPNEVRALAAADVMPSMQSTMQTLWWDHPFTVAGVDYFAGRVVLHLLGSFGADQDIEIRTNDAGMVAGFDAELVEPTIGSWADVDAELVKSHARYSYQVAKVEDGRCERVAGTNTAESLPLASIFKLYVLYAVADAVKAGTLSWDDQLVITAKSKAVDFGPLPEFPIGSTISVRTAAERMISSSSNMATDLLTDRVGPPAVERALIAAGHHDPKSMTPFPTMHELFSIGWGEPDLRQQWKDTAGSPLARAQLLDRTDSAPYQQDPERRNTPASADGIEWYGSAEDICRAHVALQLGAVGAAAPVREIMSIVAGIELDGAQWPYLAAKGGNLPGDLTFSWYALDRSGQAWVVSFQTNWPRPHGPNSVRWLLSIAQQVFAMVNGKP